MPSPISIKNRSAFHEYFIDDTYVSGMILLGTEVKSLREGKASFNDSYCIIHKGEIWIKSLRISPYSHGTVNNHDPDRDKKILLQKREIRKIQSKLKEKGYTLIPLRIFMNDRNFIKLELGLGKGKKLYDKRESIKQRDTEREMKRYLK
ncbi:MAG TPA: SsrA-binding protein SmpB [Niabella sp.]|nr:SsrA-binding protein SmpB [Niabella sp.]HOZ96698.1 SsrA-binding protein SmpB [Niabella sp.]HQW14434.1 SsrA-binding protein SmpB [Niabella sp.]HQX19849.1 SsrA-binding protein SmpB [Niabella sp.]HQX40692.1 SsrA-binding protein SmpB [Niabella sp.]